MIAGAENGVPVTGAMVDEWCSAYDKSDLPKGYDVDGIETIARRRYIYNESTPHIFNLIC